MNLLLNHSFEDGWQNIITGVGDLINQKPNFWGISWLAVGDESWAINSKEGTKPIVTNIPECVHKLKTTLPPDEWEDLILDGDAVYKMFAFNGVWGADLTQTITGLRVGQTVKVVIPVQVHYHDPLNQDSPDDVEIWLQVGDKLTKYIAIPDLPDREWVNLNVTTTVPLDGRLNLSLKVMTKWANSRDIFVDNCNAVIVADEPDCIGNPRVQYNRNYNVIPANATLARATEIFQHGWLLSKQTSGGSYDDAGIGNLSPNRKTATLWDIPTNLQDSYRDWYAQFYPHTNVIFQPEVSSDFEFEVYPVDTSTRRVNQGFGDNPEVYEPYGLPGHEGIDLYATYNTPILAVADGLVYALQNSPDNHNYGIHVRLSHEHGSDVYKTVYAHLASTNVQLGDIVLAGDVIGYADSTGNSTGTHLHFTLKRDGYTYVDEHGTWPYNIHNPEPYLEKFFMTQGNATIGLHASADGGDLYGGTAEYDEFKTLRGGVIKVMSSTSAPAIERLFHDQRQVGNDPQWIVRAFLDFGGRDVSPLNFFDWTISDVSRAFNRLRVLGVPANKIWIELHNEPNLTVEGLGSSWADGAEFNSWGLDVLSLYKATIPEAKYLYPGLSPGTASIGKQDSKGFFGASKQFALACEGTAVHMYWQSTAEWPMDKAFVELDWVVGQVGNQPIWVTEASNNKRTNPLPTTQQYASEYKLFVNKLKFRPTVGGVTYFVASASNPLFNPENWIVDGVSKGIAAAIVT